MQPFASDKIRNVALVGHKNAGKTTLAEALLYLAGAIPRRGRIEDGTTTCDWRLDEQQRGATLSLSLAPLAWRSHKINLLDTPGSAGFEGEVQAALEVADLAVFVVDAMAGVEVQTEATWHRAVELGIPQMVFVNKLDREHASFERTVDDLRAHFGAGIAPIEWPIISEGSLHGVVDLLREEALTYQDGVATAGPLPNDLVGPQHAVHDQLVEGIVVGDDTLLERYLDGQVPSLSELEATLATGVVTARVFPVVCGSALHCIGVDRLADFICEIGPSPLARPVRVRAGDTEIDVTPVATSKTLAHVFKTISDPYVGRISLFKVDTGTIHPDDHLVNSRTGADERLHGLTTVRGREHEATGAVPAGDLAAVSKLSDTATGDTLASPGSPVHVLHHPLPPPVYAVAVVAANASDEGKLAEALHRLIEEDPTLQVTRDDETHQTLLSGAGETHLTVALERIQQRFGISITTEAVRVPYRETVSTTATAEGRYKKQTGGHGQFGVVTLRVEPRPAGTGFEFLDEIVGGAIPRSFITAVQRGVEEAMADGGVLGYPVVDVAVACVDGRHHPVDSSEMSFKMAARLAFRQAQAEADPVLLEPISQLHIVVPSSLQGDVLSDLSARRGRVQHTEPLGQHDQVIEALVPRVEAQRYAIDLRALTGGRGTFHLRHDRYEVVPAPLLAELRRNEAEVG